MRPLPFGTLNKVCWRDGLMTNGLVNKQSFRGLFHQNRLLLPKILRPGAILRESPW